MTNENLIANGIPMSLEQMREYLHGCYGIPIAIRKQGTTVVVCPFCNKKHEHEPESGHHTAGCEDDDRYIGITIANRQFVPSYGYTIFEYEEGEGNNKLIVPNNLLN